jgi:hypothetical protein
MQNYSRCGRSDRGGGGGGEWLEGGRGSSPELEFLKSP